MPLYSCPNCHREAQLPVQRGVPMHECAKLRGLSAPLVPGGVPADVRAVEREDYIGGEIVQTDSDGRPYMAVVTTRDDGQDVAVLAPTAQAER